MNTKAFQGANFECISYFAPLAHKNTLLVCNKCALTSSSTLYLMQRCEQVHSYQSN